MTAMSREEWLALRRTGLGGSDIAAIMGFNKYKTPLEVLTTLYRAAFQDAVEEKGEIKSLPYAELAATWADKAGSARSPRSTNS